MALAPTMVPATRAIADTNFFITTSPYESVPRSRTKFRPLGRSCLLPEADSLHIVSPIPERNLDAAGREGASQTSRSARASKAEARIYTVFRKMVLQERIELSTSPLPRECSTPELLQR
jgi:hypothetical protein